MTSFELHPAAVSRSIHSTDESDPAAGSSFPERYFSPNQDDKVPLAAKSAALKLQISESSVASIWSQQLLHRNLTPPHGPLVDNTVFSPPLPDSASAVQAEWDLLRKQSVAEELFCWNPIQPEDNIEDDSDSIQSPNEAPEEPLPPATTWPSTRKPRRRSAHKVTKPTKAATPGQAPYSAAPPDRAYGLGFEYRTDLLGLSDVINPFVSPPNRGNSNPDGGDPEIIFETGSRSAKVDSKRIAHKLSEKTRRNRLTIAIREIQKLLPTDGENGDASQSQPRPQHEADLVFRPGVPSSKLDVVEMAVGFIRGMKKKNLEMARRVREMERRLDECHCRQASVDTVVGSSTSNDGTS